MPTDTEDHEIPGRSNATARRSRPERSDSDREVRSTVTMGTAGFPEGATRPRAKRTQRNAVTESVSVPKEQRDGKRSDQKESNGFPEGATATERRSRPKRSDSDRERSDQVYPVSSEGLGIIRFPEGGGAGVKYAQHRGGNLKALPPFRLAPLRK